MGLLDGKAGELVPRAEVEAYAKSKCKNCYGSGVFRRFYGKTAIEHVCLCASRKFIAANEGKLTFNDKQQLCWKAPADEQA